MKELRDLAHALGGLDSRGGGAVRLRQATINSVFWSTSSTGYVNLRFAGSTVDVPAKFIGSYAPQTGHVVWVLQNGPDLLVLGYANGATGQFDVGPGDATNEGGQLNLKGAGVFGDVSVDNFQGNLRFLVPGAPGAVYVIGSDGTFVAPKTLIGGVDLTAPPRAKGYQSAAQTLASGTTPIAITMTSEEYDTDGMHSTASNTSRFVCVTPGRYRVIAQVSFATQSAGTRAVYVQKNISGAQSTEAVTILPASTGNHYQQTCAEVLLPTAGDYIELFAFQNSGVNVALNTGALATFMIAAWCGTN